MSTLIIPDLHQDVAWASGLLRRYANTFDRVVMLGDYFDPPSSDAQISSVEETARFLSSLRTRFDVRFLAGNHDLPYWAEVDHAVRGTRQEDPRFSTWEFQPDAAEVISEILGIDFWHELVFATEVEGWLVSHAGIHPGLMPEQVNAADVTTLSDELRRAFLHGTEHPLLAKGRGRGGSAVTGGITWSDYRIEWSPTDLQAAGPRQIFGHCREVGSARRVGRHWCIDAGQSMCMRVSPGSEELLAPSKPGERQ